MERTEIINDQQVAEAWLKKNDYPPRKDRVTHASRVGHVCDRYLVLRRTHGDQAAPPSLRLRAIFRRGLYFEKLAVEQLEAAGWKTWDQQRAFDLVEGGEVLLTGRMDCLAKSPTTDLTHICDHKTLNPHDWERIPSGWAGYDYLKTAEKWWLRSWLAQVMSYMYVHPGAADVGLLQLINPEVPLPKFIPVEFDAAYMQTLIDRCHAVNRWTKAVMAQGMEALPDPIEYGSVCERCELLGVCLPDQAGRTPLELVDAPDAIDLVTQDRELSTKMNAIKKEYDAVHDRVKRLVGDREEIVVGDYWITKKTVNVKERIQKAYSYDMLQIKPLKAGEQTEESAA